jgi:hypothetical protein
LFCVVFNPGQQERLAYEEHLKTNLETYGKYKDLVVVSVSDFGANLKVPKRLNQRNKDYYSNKQLSILTCVCFINCSDTVRKIVVTFLSPVLNHDSLFLRDCFWKLSAMQMLKECSSLHFFSDNGQPFRDKSILPWFVEICLRILDPHAPCIMHAVGNVHTFCVNAGVCVNTCFVCVNVGTFFSYFLNLSTSFAS